MFLSEFDGCGAVWGVVEELKHGVPDANSARVQHQPIVYYLHWARLLDDSLRLVVCGGVQL